LYRSVYIGHSWQEFAKEIRKNTEENNDNYGLNTSFNIQEQLEEYMKTVHLIPINSLAVRRVQYNVEVTNSEYVALLNIYIKDPLYKHTIGYV